ncbi:DUF6090 family protein [Cellulophaga sp. Hel_I_12]|uniref:DUF6090 family protein n=1 Tax=Cellulophaga sp. Hel_I_12 TaxID=1249972 RepID=UPI000ABF9345|nr:DUF6090 family protein [Cellulophaga sp. Hel_I_12]
MQNKFNKYLLYALGEIILVVIGILIALSINNWNEAEKDHKLEHVFLLKLKSNLKADIALYKDRIEKNTLNNHHLDSSLTILKNYKSHTTVELQEHLRFIFFFHRFNPNKTTFDNLVSSGRLNIIRNDSLTESLFLYYRLISQQQESLAESIDDYSRNTMGPALLEFDFIDNSLDYTLKPIKSSFGVKPIESYVENPKIVNSISYKILFVDVIVRAYTSQITKAESIIDLIDNELMPTNYD